MSLAKLKVYNFKIPPTKKTTPKQNKKSLV